MDWTFDELGARPQLRGICAHFIHKQHGCREAHARPEIGFYSTIEHGEARECRQAKPRQARIDTEKMYPIEVSSQSWLTKFSTENYMHTDIIKYKPVKNQNVFPY